MTKTTLKAFAISRKRNGLFSLIKKAKDSAYFEIMKAYDQLVS